MLNQLQELNIGKSEINELISTNKATKSNVEKIKNGYPIQYIIGYTSFCGNKINVNKNVLIPRYETEFLVEKVNNLIKSNNIKKVLDLCTGSGCIAISIKKAFPNIQVDASDISCKALDVARLNAIQNSVRINFFQSDLFESIKGKYDLIVSNPPYISKSGYVDNNVKKYEPHLALFSKENGTYFYRLIIERLKKYLNKNGIAAFEIGEEQAQLLTNLVISSYPNSIVNVEKDLANRNRYLFVRNIE